MTSDQGDRHTEPATSIAERTGDGSSVPGADDADLGTNPWDRFGWVMATIWLLFLAFPIIAVYQSDHSLLVRVLAIGGVLLYAAVYVAGFVRLGCTETAAQATRVGVTHLSVLTLLILAVVPVLGPWVLSLVVFLVALSAFTLPLRWAGVVMVLALATAIIWPAMIGEFDSMWFFVAIILGVGVGNGLVRVLEERQTAHRALEDERQLAAERDRVARDVHDVLGHSLTVITVKAELAERLIEVNPEQAQHELAQIQALTREALAEVRATVAGLRVARLDDELERAGAALSGAGITAELPTDTSAVDPRHRIVLAWVLRELVTNVVRHSAATRCQVLLGSSWIRVTDDGVGVPEGATGHGLRGVAERIGCGTLSITTGAGGRGTEVTATLDPDADPPESARTAGEQAGTGGNRSAGTATATATATATDQPEARATTHG
ncbi:sensor histidine kinase [Pseudactinotalea sp. Z1739]|uniref:sensor histidine kinase n=1 Tax=Pseudactinotalea sp. Z1739 TaxID=3413028 RepID=UPI003C7CAFA7